MNILKKVISGSLSILGYEIRRLNHPDFYNYDSLLTNHNHDFMSEPKFMDAYATGLEAAGNKDHRTYWRAHIALLVSTWASQLGGSFAECGVADGCTSLSLLKFLELNNKPIPNYYLFDTFEGIDPDIVPVGEEAHWGESATERQSQLNKSTYTEGWNYDRVVKRFEKYESVKVFKGSVPEILENSENHFEGEKFSFIHIDMNNSAPEVGALNFFKSRLTDSAFILLDDYAYVGYGYQKKMADEWAAENGQIIASLPTGQGLLFISSAK